MGIKCFFDKGIASIKKYKYAFLVLAIGLILMAIPDSKNSPEISVDAEATTEISMEEQLKHLLQQIDGAGEVQVMLTVLTGEKTIYQTNDDRRTVSGENTDSNIEAVIITDSERNQTGLVKQVLPPTYQGAVVICQGADNPAVQLAIVDAVSKLTGLGANRISVLKMK